MVLINRFGYFFDAKLCRIQWRRRWEARAKNPVSWRPVQKKSTSRVVCSQNDVLGFSFQRAYHMSGFSKAATLYLCFVTRLSKTRPISREQNSASKYNQREKNGTLKLYTRDHNILEDELLKVISRREPSL